ncbi:hypothetical protein KVR01_000658 [Diaporthe batatas]|uniref:uncharacterized protein n=1 Tax=Diaporthe batatas TaxID=748121 RepID=UPI001D03E76E|nr:uncharacterized protein KVR01_000658 [Diaporthe batatas]KAG8169913.1 hypothetical protein KVR01_000658 [Diaporthe batatas]
MRKIFARAFTVLVYLGQESMEDDSGVAMSLLGQPERLRDFDGLTSHERSSLTNIFARPYFRRMWIVQEVALAPTLELHCGAATTYLSAFAKKPLEAIFGSGIAHPPWLKHSRYSAGLTPKTPTTASVCKDDRDRVFALLSLLPLSEEEWFKADYGLSTAQVYTGIAAFLATNGLEGAVLILASRLAVEGDSDLPSWVPNWKMLVNASMEDPKLFDHVVTRSQDFGLVGVPGVTRFGAITVRGKILGPITVSDRDLSYMAVSRNFMRERHQLDTQFWHANSVPGELDQCFTSQFTWTFIKPAQSPFDKSWECHIESRLNYKPPSHAQYLAVMLENEQIYHATVLILRQDDGSHGQYTLIEIGMPLVWGVIPMDRAWIDNEGWIEGLTQEDYKEIEVQAGLGQNWSLDHFLGLLVKDPLTTGPMEWPHTQIDREQSYEETPALPLLMQWAAVTYRFLLLLRPQSHSNIRWLARRPTPHPSQVEDFFARAMSVAHSQGSAAPLATNGHETRDSERAAFLLRKILHQFSESTDPLREQERWSPSIIRLYWSWEKFNAFLREELSSLRYVRPDIESLRSCFKTPMPDFYRADAHELLVAHGVDLRNEYTEIRIK